MDRSCITELRFYLSQEKEFYGAVMFESGNTHPSNLLLRIIELHKIGDITKIYTTT